MKKSSLAITIAVTIFSFGMIILLATSLQQNPHSANNNLLDKPAKDFSAPNIKDMNSIIQLSSFKGQKVILNFWASWCISCRSEAKELEKFYQDYGNEIKVIGIAVQDTQEAALKFAEVYRKTYLLGIDDAGRINVDYGVIGVPETFLIDESGVIKHKEVGPVTYAMLKDYYKK